MYRVERFHNNIFDDSDIPHISNLVKVLKGDPSIEITRSDYHAFLFQKSAKQLVVAREDRSGKIIGMATIFFRYILSTGVVAYIDDVVVLPEWQGKGVGSRIHNALMHVAIERGAVYIDLTSNQKRIKANEFYRKRGYRKRSTNVYRYTLG